MHKEQMNPSHVWNAKETRNPGQVNPKHKIKNMNLPNISLMSREVFSSLTFLIICFMMIISQTRT